MVVLVSDGRVGVLVCMAELVWCFVSFKAGGHVIENGYAERSQGTPGSERDPIRSGGRVAAVSYRMFYVSAADAPGTLLCG